MRCRNCQKPHSYKDTDDGYICTKREECYIEDENKRKEYSTYNFKSSSKIMFENRRWWTIQACDERYLICVKLYKDTFEYTIVDLLTCIRGSDNCYNRYNYNNVEECKQALEDLQKEELQISYRNWVPLIINKVK